MFEEKLLLFLTGFPWLICLVATFIGGEETIMFLSALAGQGVFAIYIVLIFSFVGIMISDFMWFFIGKIEGLNYFKRYEVVSKNYSRAKKFISKHTGDNEFFILLSTKFFYGIRVVALAYVGRKKMKFSKFLFYNSIVNIVWILTFAIVGFFAGKGISMFLNIYENVSFLLVLFFGILVFLYVIKNIIKRLISR
ncbi:MAG: VTT domain-containing protein [archaeon]